MSGSEGRVCEQKTTVGSAFLKRFRRLACKLVAALAVLKEEKIVHADIKPENVFIRPTRQWYGRDDHGASDGDGDVVARPDMPVLPRKRRAKGEASLCANFLSLPSDDFEVNLGDFGNSCHMSEVSKFYQDFNLQSLPYRSPEVLLGVPFGSQIDIWSLGVVLLELIMGRTLFRCSRREDLFKEMCTVLTPPPLLRFSGGKYTAELFPVVAAESTHSQLTEECLAECKCDDAFNVSPCSYNDHIRVIHSLIADRFDSSLPCPPDLLHFLGGMLLPDPDIRLTAVDLLVHDFLAADVAVPRTLLSHHIRSKQVTRRKCANGLAALRR